MSDIFFIIGTFGKVLADNPGQLLPFLAYASAATMVAAIVSDALLRKRRASETNTAQAKAITSLR